MTTPELRKETTMLRRALRTLVVTTTLFLSLAPLATAQKPAANAVPEQFVVTVIQGASEAEAQRLVSGRKSSTISTGTSRSQRQSASLRVSEGIPARIERGSEADVLDSVYFGLWPAGAGASLRTVEATSGYEVTVTRRGAKLELQLAPWSTQRGPDLQTERDVQSLSTTVVVEPGGWTRVAGADAPAEGKAKRYGAGTPDAGGAVLVQIAPGR